MKKIMVVSLAAIAFATSANAGWLESLGLVKKAEPTTLEEACDTAEIKKICPEIVLGTKTIPQCLAENITSLSKKCSTFVKKSILDKKDAAVATVESVKEGMNDAAAAASADKDARGAEAKEAVSAKVAEARADADAKKAAVKEKVAADKAAAAETKAAAKSAGKEIVGAFRETGAAAKETGKSIKEMF